MFVYARCLATVVRIDGEIDAANARDLTEAIRGFARLKTPVVLDVSRLRFLKTSLRRDGVSSPTWAGLDSRVAGSRAAPRRSPAALNHRTGWRFDPALRSGPA